MSIRRWISSIALLSVVVGTGALWARSSTPVKALPAAGEPSESITVAAARAFEHRPTTSAIGTVVALRSVSLRNELPGTVREVRLSPGQLVEEGEVLLRLDVSVESAELKAQTAQIELAESLAGRIERALKTRSASEAEFDRARAERDIARAQAERTSALIERKTIRAPFRGRVGLSDIHPGQYLEQGTLITTLQGTADAAYVDFSVAQAVAAGLKVGESIQVGGQPGTIIAIDARVDPSTRNAWIRARVDGSTPAPGASVRVKVPAGPARSSIAIPANALRKGPEGDHVFVVSTAADGQLRASVRRVVAGELLGDEILIEEGLSTEEQVAASGSFKLRDGVRVASR